MRATVKDVARLAQVSPKTVSNVVTGTTPVSDAMRARVEAAMLELDYVPNLSARALRNGRSGLIALALPDLSTPYSAEMAHHFVVAAGTRGLGVQIEETAVSGERERQLISRARAHLIDGLILNPVLLPNVTVQDGVRLPPTVFIGEVEQSVGDYVWVDNVAAVRELTSYLVDLGHRRIAIMGVMKSETSRLRLKGYRAALRAARIRRDPVLEIFGPKWSPAGAYAAITAYLEHHDLPEAIVCMTDSIAAGVLNALWTLGHRVPDDVSVVGYDNVADSAFAVPPLTTIDFDKDAYASTALDLLEARIADRDRPIERVTMPHRLLIRASTAARR
ncbi:LacI family DNA-binding transcriptional regulator [Microlunatus aurantiacus]|uniref:LacI family DNA-binding transcriptional regulator n=1 Tax=Microlunatus aurantiacus TaxID=446786 RepID=A0ABP7EHG3_9ACTN